MMKKQRNWYTWAGNLLIMLSIAGTIFIYLPLILVYINPPAQTLPPHTMFSISIPKIRAVAPIVANVDPWNKTEYLEGLSQGVAHAYNTALPEQTGTMYLFAHSSDAPWRLTRYNTIFFRLNELDTGDLIVITKDEHEYRYFVTGKQVVWPTQIEVLQEAQDVSKRENTQTLVLQTCYPLGTDLKRLLVFAELPQ